MGMCTLIKHGFSLLGFLLICQLNASSLFNEANFKSLTADKRAGQPGDTVTILVMENAQAKSSAGSSTERESSLQLQAKNPNKSWPYGIEVGTAASGDAAVNRNGYVKAQITAVVERRDENGNLEISGEQEITIDGEVQSIQIRGWIRPADISANNVVPSFRLFNARIRFTGEGQVSENQRAGVFSRVMSWLGL
jgi:flagellar L-ring protein precursor FlgH